MKFLIVNSKLLVSDGLYHGVNQQPTHSPHRFENGTQFGEKSDTKVELPVRGDSSSVGS